MGKPRLKRGFWWRNGTIHTRDPVTGERTSTRCHDPRAAELWRAERERLAANPAYAASRKATVGEWVRRTLMHKESARSAGTLNMYEVKLGHFVRLFGAAAPLATITPGAVDDYITTRRKEGVKNNTISRELTCLWQLLKLAKRSGQFAGDLDALKPVDFSPGYVPTKRVLLRSDLPALWAALQDDVERAWVALAIATGADASDIERAQPVDYDPIRNVFRVRGTKTKTRDAEVPVLPHVAELFHYALERLPVSWPRSSKALGEACRRAGIPHLSPKDLRRTAASWLIAAGADQSDVGRFLRHSSDAMVRLVYGQLKPEELGTLLLPAASTLASQSQENHSGPLGGTADAEDLKSSASVSGAQRISVFSGDAASAHVAECRDETQIDPLVGTNESQAVQTFAAPEAAIRSRRDSRDTTVQGRGTGSPAERHPGKARTLERDQAVGSVGPATRDDAEGGVFGRFALEAHSPAAWSLAIAAESLGLGAR